MGTTALRDEMTTMEETAECRLCELSQKKIGFQLKLKEVYSETCRDEKNQMFCLSAGKVTSDAEEVILSFFFTFTYSIRSGGCT